MITKYFTASVVYFFAFIATACMSVATLMFIEKNIGLHTFFLTGDIDIVVALLLFGNLFFYLVNLFILKQEVSSSSLCRMHIKQSFLLYILFFVSMPMVAGMLHGFISIENYSVGIGAGYGVIIFLTALLGIIINLLFLYVSKKNIQFSITFISFFL